LGQNVFQNVFISTGGPSESIRDFGVALGVTAGVPDTSNSLGLLSLGLAAVLIPGRGVPLLGRR
jgi:hypothetical protein